MSLLLQPLIGIWNAARNVVVNPFRKDTGEDPQPSRRKFRGFRRGNKIASSTITMMDSSARADAMEAQDQPPPPLQNQDNDMTPKDDSFHSVSLSASTDWLRTLTGFEVLLDNQDDTQANMVGGGGSDNKTMAQGDDVGGDNHPTKKNPFQN